MLDEDAIGTLDKLVQDGERDACRIAVIGQVKAGKSTLVNALIRRPGFLPTDVNPWTAVVTNMHFGRPSDAGAVYQFFDEADWRRLGAGGRLQELSQRLGMMLDADTLVNQVRFMRERAEHRLGRQFQQLLGKQHRFASASAEVLERYVCVGDLEPADYPNSGIGRFADITKSADLYFDLPPFAYATTIVDTPGTNDPFLVREELSREALEGADAYIIVLNAQQALSSSDLSLLRLLHGLQKSRLVVFVNRIDLLPNPVADGEIVVAHIRGKLAVEFPGVAIPVIAGSGMWAEWALTSDEVTARTPSRVEAIQAVIRKHGSRQILSRNAAAWRTEVMRFSGLNELTEILSRLIVQGPTMLRLQRNQSALHDMVLKVDLAARGELHSLEQWIASAYEDQAATAHRRAEAAGELQRIDSMPAAIAKRVEAVGQNLELVKGLASRRLDAALRNIIRRHIVAASNTLLAQPRFTRHEHVWQFDTLPLRRDLDYQFQRIYRETVEQLREIERTANTEILDEVRDLVPKNALVTEDVPIRPIDPAPSISALGQIVAIELDEQWRAWWRLWHGQRQRARRLERLLNTEFHPVADALADAAAAELDAHVEASIQRFSQLGHDLVAMLNRRRLDLEASRRDEMNGLQDDAQKPGALIQDYQARQKYLEQRIQNCARIAATLKLLIHRCAAFGSAAGHLSAR